MFLFCFVLPESSKNASRSDWAFGHRTCVREAAKLVLVKVTGQHEVWQNWRCRTRLWTFNSSYFQKWWEIISQEADLRRMKTPSIKLNHDINFLWIKTHQIKRLTSLFSRDLKLNLKNQKWPPSIKNFHNAQNHSWHRICRPLMWPLSLVVVSKV